jgi:hypothetical protein
MYDIIQNLKICSGRLRKKSNLEKFEERGLRLAAASQEK